MSKNKVLHKVYCAKRSCVYAVLFGFFVCAQSIAVFGKDGKEGKDSKSADPTPDNVSEVIKFQWSDHSKLSWDDFRGPVNAETDESAAATHCSIGFVTNNAGPGNKFTITVYNTFYTNKSWVRPDAKLPGILEHEQGHFDLCEIYTRKLRNRMANFDYTVKDIKQALMAIYSEISQEYENRQQAYEQETTHGVNIPQQKKWSNAIAGELAASL